MPRKTLIKSSEHFYHVYNRSNQKHWYAIPMEVVWKIAQDSLAFAYEKHPVDIAQFVLMTNHYHMLIKTPELNLSDFMYEFGKRFSLALRKESNLINRMFGGRYKASLIKNETHLLRIYQYIYQNPLRVGLSTRVEQYEFSSAFYKFHNIDFIIPLCSIYFSEKDIFEICNESLDKDYVDKLRKGLKKTEFKPNLK